MSKNDITVLLVEDELTLAMIIKDTLEENGFTIHTASDGEEGLHLFFELRPDVLVADVMMPKMDGFEMVRRIRQTDKQTPVLFLTARSAINDVVEGFELGANDYLKKPFGMQELIIRIKALMGKAFSFTETKVSSRFEIGSYLFDPVAQTLLHAGVRQELSHRESEILKRLCEMTVSSIPGVCMYSSRNCGISCRRMSKYVSSMCGESAINSLQTKL